MKNKILLAGILVLTILIAISVAHATVYVHKIADELNVGEVEGGLENNYFTYDYTNKEIDARFRRNATYWDHWLFPLGTTLDSDSSYFVRFNFTAPSSVSASSQPFAMFGLFNTAEWGSNVNAFAFFHATNAASREVYLILWNSTSGVNNNATGYYNGYEANQEYYLDIIHDAGTNTLTTNLYYTNDTLVKERTVSTSGHSFSLTHVGLSGFKAATPALYSNDWHITGIHANSGTSYEVPSGTCYDSTKNQDETDVDCGGSTCSARCSLGLDCYLGTDCKTGICSGGTCGTNTISFDRRTTSFNESDIVTKNSDSYMYVTEDGVISSKFYRRNQWDAIMYPLETPLDQTDNFYVRFEIMSPQSTSASVQPYACFGLMNSDEVYLVPNSLFTCFFHATTPASRQIYFYAIEDDSTQEYIATGHTWLASTEYVIEIWNNLLQNEFITKVSFSNGTVVAQLALPSSGRTYDLTHVGISNIKSTTTGYFSYYWNITKIKVNTGETEGNSSSILPESGLIFTKVSGGDNVVGYGQTGSGVGVYVNNTTSGKIVGEITVDFSTGSDINLPTIFSEMDVNRTLMHNTSGVWPSEVTARYIYVPKVGGYYPYHCPLASTLDEVNLTCNNIDLSPDYTEVNIGGTTYFRMSNQGGGNGGEGGSVPEFSDLGWILAAVLGGGGFVLIRRKKAF